MPRSILSSLLLTAACTGEAVQGDPMITGHIATADDSVDVAGRKAYGFHIQGKGFWYVTTSSDASCDQVLEYLNHTESNDRYDPSEVLYGGYCNLTLVSDYEGADLDLTEDDALIAFWSLYCPMGTGEFVYENRHGHSDYFWSGNMWTGRPVSWSATISGDGETDGYTIDVDMSDFDGNYSDVIGGIPGTGAVSGTIEAEWCPDLYQANAFPK